MERMKEDFKKARELREKGKHKYENGFVLVFFGGNASFSHKTRSIKDTQGTG